MQFTVLERFTQPPPHVPGAFLVSDNWDDYSYKTFFTLWCSDGQQQVEIGNVRIATFGMQAGRVSVPDTFEELDERQYFSLGTDETYYARLRELGDETRETVLHLLRDLAFGPRSTLERALQEEVTRVSLMRGIELATVTGQFARIARGGEVLSKYHFVYVSPSMLVAGGAPPLALGFKVAPHVLPPTNVHVLIGRNGVGKSHLLNGITRTLMNPEGGHGTLAFVDQDDAEDASTQRFVNVVSVSFSAFDEFEPVDTSRDDLTYAHVGLRRPGEQHAMTADELAGEFTECAHACLVGSERRAALFRRALATLETDPIFQDANVAVLSTIAHNPGEVLGLFRRLSSGHKIVLLTITKLVQLVTERSLVLIDEPEAHLHPPLLSALVRALSDLLTERNGVAIIATHSPVVLQEVPKEAVWAIRRFGQHRAADRPDLETFGENVGVLTREIFGLEVSKSGFHRALEEAIAQDLTYDEVLARFNHQLGMEGRALARAAIAYRDARRAF
ncbi:ATP-binding cassette domain-containing protein [Streptomyces aquilus]|uniref:ATP-binding cassette domain-containing protein n=1 Tax=Streptomyces aquilus TaxID=2548456 RepID=A0A3Q9C6Y4_9ACTN|nr:AAA family ATPase [Streptomyces aquilus]AZP23765.1 ATP-binding cassette domain-containing protein [Streptomyces aquilus]